MIRTVLTTPVGWLLLFALVVALGWIVAAVADSNPHMPHPHAPRWLPILVSYVLIAWVAIRIDVMQPRRPAPRRRRDT